jgi:phosphoribosylglycinamide formyltransferase 2
MADADALRGLIDAERPRIIVPEIEAIATDVLVEVEQAGLCEVIPTARAARLTMNREGIRRLAAEELGLPTSAYAFADDFAELQRHADAIGYPCIVKPVMSSSGKGQSRLESPTTCGRLGLCDGRRSREPRPGHRRAGGGVRFRDHAAHGAHRCRRRADRDPFLRPGRPSPGARRLCRELATPADDRHGAGKGPPTSPRITGALGGRGLFGVELFVRGDEVWFSEVSPRPHDTGMVTMASQRQSEFDLHARAILGLPVDTSRDAVAASAVIYGGMDAVGIAYDGLAEALAVPESDLRLFGKPESFTRRRMGVALARGADTDQARERAAQVAQAVVTLAP